MMPEEKPDLPPEPAGLTATHWGNFRVRTDASGVLDVRPASTDSAPSVLGRNLAATRDAKCRIADPMVRVGYLRFGRHGMGSARGKDAFVKVSWDQALDLAAESLRDVRRRRGDSAVYGSSYGWASAGRFHHAQSQIHRFLRLGGGYTDSINDYSSGAASVIVPRIVGMNFYPACAEAPPAKDIIAHCRLIVCFGGLSLKNNQVAPGGVGNHGAREHLQALKSAGVEFISVSAIRDDTSDFLHAEWLACRPNSDVALMLGVAHTLLQANLHDAQFLERYTHGFDRVANYLHGKSDGEAKSAEWAARLTGVPAARIRALAIQMASERTLIGLSLSIQRAEHGEQTYWAGTTLAAMLGYIGLPGGGIIFGYGVFNSSFMERKRLNFSVGSLPQGENAVRSFIPVARLTDMLEHPGEIFDYNGRRLAYPEIGLIYWAGGNPFHHHQDLNRLERAWARPETIIVHEMYWTATARRADIVFPVATPLERNDFAGTSSDTWLTPMRQVVAPYANARSDYAVFSALAARLGYGDQFTDSRSEMQWVRHLYADTRAAAAGAGVELPPFDVFWEGESVDLRPQLPEREFAFEAFRRDPLRYPLKTESGRIQLFSETIASFGYDDCIGHAAWFDKTEWSGAAGKFPLHLISSQPPTRLHSQLDHGAASRERKVAGREAVRMNPIDAAPRGIRDGDLVRIFNDRGALLAGAVLSENLMPGVIQIATGAWFDSQLVAGEALDVHGNPNSVTRDIGTSRLAQGTTAHTCVCEMARFEGPAPALSVFEQPRIVSET